MSAYAAEEARTTNEPFPNVSLSVVSSNRQECTTQDITTEVDVAKPLKMLSECFTTSATACTNKSKIVISSYRTNAVEGLLSLLQVYTQQISIDKKRNSPIQLSTEAPQQ